jgi:hypothetical protein
MLSLALEQLAEDRLVVWSREVAQIEFVPEEGSGGGLVDDLHRPLDAGQVLKHRAEDFMSLNYISDGIYEHLDIEISFQRQGKLNVICRAGLLRFPQVVLLWRQAKAFNWCLIHLDLRVFMKL